MALGIQLFERNLFRDLRIGALRGNAYSRGAASGSHMFQGFQSRDGVFNQCLRATWRARSLTGHEVAKDDFIGIGGWRTFQCVLRIQHFVQIARLTAGHAFARCRRQKAGILLQGVKRFPFLLFRQRRVGGDLVRCLELGVGLLNLVLAGFVRGAVADVVESYSGVVSGLFNEP